MSGYVKLVSAEGHEFFVHRECANVSQTIGAMLSGELRTTPWPKVRLLCTHDVRGVFRRTSSNLMWPAFFNSNLSCHQHHRL